MLAASLFTSCVKKEYDQPETANLDPSLTVTNTLKTLQDSAIGAAPRLITTDVIVAGVVIADDKSGNFYKEIVIQDSTAGFSIQVDQSNFNTDYPIGRRIFIKCNGLYVGKDNQGNYLLGSLNGSAVGRIPGGLLSKYIVKGQWGQYVVPKVYNVNSVGIPSNTLVRFNAVEFQSPDNMIPYANASTLTSANRKITDCANNTITLYTSGYSTFASQLTPNGNGYVVGVMKLYNGYELIIRDTRDVQMTDSIRCDGSTGGLTLMSVDSLRSLFTGSSITTPVGKKIRGVIISDFQNGNLNSQNIVVQDGNSGIVVRFSAAHSFPLNALVEVNISGSTLSEFRGTLQVGNLNPALCTVVGTGSVTPRIATINDIIVNFNAWESTLVKVNTATISSATGTVYSSTSTILNDGSGSSIALFTYTTAAFGSATFPTTPVSVTGIVGEYTTTTFNPQLSMRLLSDVQ